MQNQHVYANDTGVTGSGTLGADSLDFANLIESNNTGVTGFTGFTTLTQSLVYIIVSPIIGKLVEVSGNYHWVMVGAGLWVLPGCVYWLVHASFYKPPPKVGRSLADLVSDKV